ncbi:DnaJ domain-containing protein [Mollisia scopiformis]|uniref:DnaJ domain-containing protein n=1 Tax=Mollisia scopiformis TaxID=149040 RepID=A0A194XPS0_MOLSC|nr:DnaJ domain-containing protein [Mollisia scopiformis]KUJ21742.1 DnaJ domain-containing protein [Mollisia scopiformis]
MPRKAKKDIDLEDMMDDEPPKIEPYTVLGIEKTATPDNIKSAYRKAALKHHPDKASEDKKEEAHAKFQEIAFAYAVLSDPIRRKRYDVTGSTSESIDIDDDFSWAEFYSEQFRDIITPDAIDAFAKQYKKSDEEKDDVLAAYEKFKGKWAGIYETVMLSNCLEDEERFREYIDEAIKRGDVKPFRAYMSESESAKEARMKAARDEGTEAEEYAKELGVHDKLYARKGKPKGEDELMALIQKKNASQGASFLDKLEAKYAGNASSSARRQNKRGTKRGSEEMDDGEPSEEAFQAAAKRLKEGNQYGGRKKSDGKKTKRKKA